MNTSHINEFISHVNRFFGVYMDAIWGFDLVNKEAKSAKKATFIGFEPDLPEKPLTHEEMLNHTINFPTRKVVIQRNENNGANVTTMKQMVISSIYNLWEDVYRKKISDELLLTEKNELVIPALGDLRLFRISIEHHNSIAKPEVEKTTIFNWFKNGDTIDFTKEQMLEIKNYFNNQFAKDCLSLKRH